MHGHSYTKHLDTGIFGHSDTKHLDTGIYGKIYMKGILLIHDTYVWILVYRDALQLDYCSTVQKNLITAVQYKTT